MKKLLALAASAVLTIAACVSLVGCGAKEINYTPADDQLASLTEVKAGTSDIAVIDSVMANYYLTKSSYKDLQILTGSDFTFESEFYAIGFRKNTNTKDYINWALYDLQEDGVLGSIASTYGMGSVIKTIPETEQPEMPEDGTDFKAILDSGSFKLGYTIFEPIAFKGPDTTLIGFDIDIAKKVCEKLSIAYNKTITLDSILINWPEKETELNSKNIDCIWNGFTYSDERAQNLDFSEPYATNTQVIVIRKTDAEKYATYQEMKDAKFTAEGGSAGEDTIKEIINKKIFG